MSADLTTHSTQSVGKRIAANTGLMVGAKFLAVVLGIFSFVIASRALTPVEFGTVVFLHAYMLFFSEVITFKSWQSLIRFGSDDLNNKDVNKLTKLISFCYRLDFISTIFAYAASVALMGFVVWVVGRFPALAPENGFDVPTIQKYAALYCLVLLVRWRDTSIGIHRLFDKFVILAFVALVMPVVRLAGAIYAWRAGWGIEGFLGVWFAASFASYIVMFSCGILELIKRRLFGMVMRAKFNFWKLRPKIWPFVIKSNIDSAMAAGTLHLPMLLVMAFFGAAWVGIYKIAEELAKMLTEGFKLLDQVIYPELAKLVSAGNADKIWRIVKRAALYLVSIGAMLSILVFLFGGPVLVSIFGEEFHSAAPLASLLVPAAALMGIAAPLFPIFYASDVPERAIYVRGAALLVYVLAFIVLSLTIGRMAPGWAMLVGNLFLVGSVVIVARRSLRKTVSRQNNVNHSSPDNDNMDQPVSQKGVTLIGDTDKRLWGLPLAEWQRRAFKKVGAEQVKGPIVADVNRVLSSNLLKRFVAQPNTALIVDDQVVAINGLSVAKGSVLIGNPTTKIDWSSLGIRPVAPSDLDDGYDKTLRKREAPYALDINKTPVTEILQRQFNSSYKGITDFVTKYFWPKPAFYATRFCAWLRLTPNMVTTLSLIFMFIALYYFWQGQWFLGFLTGWFMTFLDTVDGKLARTTMTYSSWGNIYDHGIDLVHPPFWYIAWFVGLGGSWAGPEILLTALFAILLGYAVDRAIEGIFIWLHGFHIHVWKPINSGLRFIIARRNPNMFIFMIGVLLAAFIPGAAQGGFIAVAVWTWICIAFNIGVVLVSLIAKRPLVSWMDR